LSAKVAYLEAETARLIDTTGQQIRVVDIGRYLRSKRIYFNAEISICQI